MSVKLKLKQIRKEKNLTQSQVAKSLGITRERYGLYETGKRQMSIEMLDKMAEFYSISVDYMIGRCENNNQRLSKDEKQLLEIYNIVDERGKKTILTVAQTQKQLSK